MVPINVEDTPGTDKPGTPPIITSVGFEPSANGPVKRSEAIELDAESLRVLLELNERHVNATLRARLEELGEQRILQLIEEEAASRQREFMAKLLRQFSVLTTSVVSVVAVLAAVGAASGSVPALVLALAVVVASVLAFATNTYSMSIRAKRRSKEGAMSDAGRDA